MSITCQLKIYNQSNSPKYYYLFQDAPQPQNGPYGKVFPNVYDCSPQLQSGNDSQVTWQCSSDFYAIYGTAQSVRGTTKVTISDNRKVSLGPDGSQFRVNINEQGDASFSQDRQPSIAARGGFAISTGEFAFPNPRNTYIGIGSPSPRGGGKIVPIQTYVAEPQLRSVLFPKLIYFVATGEYEVGALLDRADMGTALKVEFSGAAIPSVSLYQGNNGSFFDRDTDREITGSPWTTRNGVRLSVANANGW